MVRKNTTAPKSKKETDKSFVCNKTKTSNNDNIIDTSNPKVCYFSVPMPFDTRAIDYIASINQNYKKCKISTLFNNIPNPLNKKFNEWIMVERGGNENIKSYDDFAKYAEYAKSKGFDVCFLMNSPKPFSFDDFRSYEGEYHALLDMLR